jgi:hypothetical protein
MKRAVGFCLNDKCEDYTRGCFILGDDLSNKYYCTSCRVSGRIVYEAGTFTTNHEYFREVRIEHSYDPITDTYKGLVIVTDMELDEGNVFTLYSPLIRTDKRALRVAEGILSTLVHTAPKEGEVPASNETVLSMSMPINEFRQQLDRLIDRWESSPVTKVKRLKGVR